jgi:hypothetical protein
MKNYNIVCYTETDKYSIMGIIRAAGATLTGVSGYGSGYYIQFDATATQAETINKRLEAAA